MEQGSPGQGWTQGIVLNQMHKDTSFKASKQVLHRRKGEGKGKEKGKSERTRISRLYAPLRSRLLRTSEGNDEAPKARAEAAEPARREGPASAHLS